MVMEFINRVTVFLETLVRVSLYILLIGLILTILVFILYKVVTTKQHRKKSGLQVKRKPEGIVFGKKRGRYVCSPTNAENFCIVLGSSGVGKTTALVQPTVNSWCGNVFAIDISGDIVKNVTTDNILIFEPDNPNSVPYNIFAMIDNIKNVEEKNEALVQLSYLIMRPDPTANANARYFEEEGRKILIASLISFYHSGKDFCEICKIMINNSHSELFRLIDNTKNKQAISYINAFGGNSESNISGCKQSANNSVVLFATNHRLLNTLRRNKESISPMKLEEQSVYILIDDTKLEMYAPLLNIIVSQTLQYLSNRENYSLPKILVCLDEFSSLGRLEILPALRKLRKKGVRIIILTQSLADLELTYGPKETKSLLENLQLKVVMSANEYDTQIYLARLIGYVDTYKKSRTSNPHAISYTSQTITEDKKFAIEPSDLATLGNKLVLIHPAGYEVLKKNYYFKYRKGRFKK